MPESRGRVGPLLVLAVSAVLVMCVAAYGTANNWFSGITGEVYKVDSGTAAQAEPSVPVATASPSAGAQDPDYVAGFAAGKKDGYKRGYIRGRKDSFRHGYQVGMNQGIKATKDAGYNAGYPAGERAGRKAGVKKLEADYLAWRANK